MTSFAVYHGTEVVAQHHRGAVIAVGNFDGLHRGHQTLVALAQAQARGAAKAFGLLTFEPHPRTFFRPHEPVFRLTPLALKIRLAKAMGADFLVCLAFDEILATSSAEDFIQRELVDRLGVSHVVTGYDFHFGKGRRGTADLLSRFGRLHGFEVTSVEQVTDDGDTTGAPFSSSSIRSALRRGHMREAARELGYPWTVMGEVVHGDKRGRTIGFPTANITLEPGAEPFRGIYALLVRDASQSGSSFWMGAGYFGDRPTFNTNRTFLEAYLLDQSLDLYGRTLMVSFIDLVRGDKTFRSVDDLVQQMTADCQRVREIFADWALHDPCAEFLLGGYIRNGQL
jgi:riboflavin kinase / FMN adenylyltransferase